MINPRCLAILALLAFAVCDLRAEIVQSLNIQLSATAQGPTNENSSIMTLKFDTMRVTTKDIINLLGDATSMDFSTNSRLVVVDFNSVQVISGGDAFDVSGFFLNEQTSDDVSHDTLNNLTGREHRRIMRIELFAFDDLLGSNFNLTGFATEIFSASAIDEDDGSQKISDRKTLNGSGLGQVGEAPAIFRGSISARGTGE